MEIAPRYNQILVWPHRWVVGYRVYFGFNHLRHVGYGIPTGTMNLGHAPEGVGVLHMRLLTGYQLAAR